MSLDFRRMSLQELQFVRLYALLLKKHFALFVSALNMMRTNELGLKCPVEASRLAQGLHVMHAEFEQTLAEIARSGKFREKSEGIAHPTTDELTQIIQISFFKLVEPGSGAQFSEDLGWFSGHPLEWEKSWQQATKQGEFTNTSIATALINALANLFNMGYSAKFKKPPPEPYEEPDQDDDWYEQDDYDNY